MVQPYLDYCSSTWYSGISQVLWNRLDVVQRQMIKFIFSKDAFYHVTLSDFKQLSWMTFSDRVKYFKLCLVFKIRKGLAPSYLSQGFRPILDCHSHATRASTYDYLVSGDISTSPTSFTYTAVKHWNSLPPSLKCIPSLMNFKKRLREHTMSSYWLLLAPFTYASWSRLW